MITPFRIMLKKILRNKKIEKKNQTHIPIKMFLFEYLLMHSNFIFEQILHTILVFRKFVHDIFNSNFNKIECQLMFIKHLKGR